MDERMDVLELSELEGGPEGIGADGYCQLLALYLLKGQLEHSKFLWKRIPSSMKSSSPELSALWGLAQKLWLKDIPGFYSAASNQQWSTAIQPIVQQLVEEVRSKMKRLISTAYVTIRLNEFGDLLSLSKEEAMTTIGNENWVLNSNTGMVEPKESPQSNSNTHSADDQLAKLTNYVSVLEN